MTKSLRQLQRHDFGNDASSRAGDAEGDAYDGDDMSPLTTMAIDEETQAVTVGGVGRRKRPGKPSKKRTLRVRLFLRTTACALALRYPGAGTTGRFRKEATGQHV